MKHFTFLTNWSSRKSVQVMTRTKPGNDHDLSRTCVRLDSHLSRLCLASLICLCMLTVGVGNAWATTITNAVYTFGSGSTPSGWSVGSSNTHVANYLKFSSGDYLEMTTASIFTSGEVLYSNNMQVEVSCGTFGSWSGSSYSVKCTVELRNSSGTVLSTANATFSGLNNSEGTYRTAINVAKPANPSAIAKLRITFTNFTTGTTLRVKNVRLNYSTAAAATYNVYLMSGCTGGSYSSNKGTSGSGTGTYSSCTKYSGISAGTSVTITATPSSGYEFDGWEDSGYSIIYDASDNEITPSSSTSTTATFTMPSKDVVIWYCNFSESCANSVTISKGTGTNCTFTLSKSGSQASCDGVSTTVTVSPTSGYGNPSVTQTGASAAPTITGSSNTYTVAYGANTTGTSTINVSCSANNYTINLNTDLTPTSAGTTSIAATYNASTNLTSAITKPTKTGWTFGGYYTAKNGGGTQIIDASGNVIASVSGYTDASKNWKYAGNITLYAKWTCTVTWSVSGATNVYSTQTVTYNSSGSKVASIPGPPSPASYCGDKFVGWTTESSVSQDNDTGLGLFTTVSGSPDIKNIGDITFYAVFADYDE